jgi:hypothetical protein
MRVKLDTLRQKIKQHWVAIVVVAIALVAVIVLIVLAYKLDWTGFNRQIGPKLDQNQQYRPEKTLWDWLQLLIIPIVLAVGGYWLNQIQKSREEKTTEDNQRENALQTYLDRMSELLLHEELSDSLKADGLLEVGKIARTRTKVALTRLDGKRKGSVLKFLYESYLIKRGQRIVDISRAELDGAYLRQFNLSEANLSGANLSRADLSGANLRGADLCCSTSSEGKRPTKLTGAILKGANLSKADMSNADLSGADLQGADLSAADLNGANLQGANLSDADLSGANLQGANYNTKRVKWKDVQGNTLVLEPTQWPQKFNSAAKGTICANRVLQYSEDCHLK